jgi:hypothetical protein
MDVTVKAYQNEVFVMKPVTRHMTNEQRAEISASKRFDKEKQNEQWTLWKNFYLNKLETEIIPAQNIGQYVRIRPKDLEALPVAG